MQNITDICNILDKTTISVNTVSADMKLLKEAANESSDTIEFLNNLFIKFKMPLPCMQSIPGIPGISNNPVNTQRWSRKWQ